MQEILGTPAFFSCAYKCSDPSISPAIIGEELICSGGNKVYTTSNLPSGATLNWSNSTNLNYVSGQGTGTYTLINPNPSTKDYAEVSINIAADCHTRILNKTLWIGAPATVENIWFSGTLDEPPFEACKSMAYTVEANDPANLSGTTIYNWDASGIGNVINGQGTTSATIHMFNTVNSGYISVTPQNLCGYGIPSGVDVNVIDCSGGGGIDLMSVYPNPASEELLITYRDDSLSQDTQLPEAITVELISPMLQKVYSQETKKTITRIPIANLPEGMYYLNIKRKKDVMQRKIKIDH